MSRRALLLDDEPLLLRVTTAMLEHLGWTVTAVGTGPEAVAAYERALCAEERFDVAVLDLTMPAGDGALRVLHALLALDASVRAIVSTGYVDDPIAVRYADYGFAGVLYKPYTLEQLEAALPWEE